MKPLEGRELGSTVQCYHFFSPDWADIIPFTQNFDNLKNHTNS